VGDLAKTIGLWIKNLREQKGISQERLGELADLHRTYIGQMERGEANVTLETLDKVTEALGVTVVQLFRLISPDENIKMSYTLSQIMSALQDRSDKDQKAILQVLRTVFDWKDNT
jgi:transcriptional regulator with XRE-family HTH domain